MAGRHDGRRLPRPADPAGLGQVRGLHPARRRRRSRPGRPVRAPRADRAPVRRPRPAGGQPPRHDPDPGPGTLELRREIVPVADVVDDAVHTMANEVAHHRHIELPSDLPPVDVDQVLMVQVLANLLENAARYSPEGRAGRGRGLRARRRWWRCRCDDHGPGVAAGRPGADLPDVQPGERRWPGRPRPHHRQGLRGGPRPEHPGRRTRRRRGPSSRSPCPGRSCRPRRVREGGGSVARILLVDDDASLLRALRIGPSRPRLRGGRRPAPVPKASPRRRSPRQTWWCSTSGFPTSTGSRSAGGCARGARCRSSCCRRPGPRTARWPPSTAGPMTT